MALQATCTLFPGTIPTSRYIVTYTGYASVPRRGTMKHSTWFRIAFLLLAAVGALVMSRPALANPIVPVTLDYEHEGLDLDTGTIVPIDFPLFPVDPANPQPDLVLAYNSERAVCTVVFHNRMNGVEIAFLDGVAFNMVDSADLVGLRFTAAVIDDPFETGDSIVLRTDTGAHYLLGNPIEDAAGVTFDTQLLDETTAGLVRPAAAGSQIRRVIDDGQLQTLTSLNPTVVDEDAKLRASVGVIQDRFGESVAISGDTAVVGAWGNDGGGLTDSGSAYVFVRDGTSWSEQAKLMAGDAAAGDQFGRYVALSGDTVVVGASQADLLGAENAGAAYVFVYDGTSWSEQAKLTASDTAAYKFFGGRAALTGDTLVVGASGDDHGGFQSGSAYVFVRNGTSWSEQAKLTASDAGAIDYFGVSVALSGDTAVVGASGHDDDGSRTGSAYVFVRNGTSWSEQAKLTPSDAPANASFGRGVALLGDTAVVGAEGAGSAYVFVRNGTSWSEQAKLTASDAGATGDGFGRSVALTDETAVVGAYGNDHVGAANAGSAYFFVRNGTSWSEEAKLTASDAAENDYLGWSVSVSGETAVAGAWGDDDGGNQSGSAYVFTRCGNPDTIEPQISVVLDLDTLWPPNHHMFDVVATVTARDACGPPILALASLTSNEADNAPGTSDGETTGDIQPGVDDFHFKLRAERDSTGSGRIYTAVYTATDDSGNVASGTGLVAVPHDQDGVVDPVAIVLGPSASGTVVSWAAVPDAQSYDVIRGELTNVMVTGELIDLGTVVCIEEDSTDESTLGWEDGELPEPGRAFFYLVEYFDGITSTYGTESAAYPRAPGSGGCLGQIPL